MAGFGIDTDSLRGLIERARTARLFRVMGVYLIASWAALQAIDLLSSQFGLPAWFFPLGLGLVVAGLPVIFATALLQTPPCVDGRDPGASAGSAPPPRRLSRMLTWRRAILGGVLAFLSLGIAGATVIWARNRGRVLMDDAVAVMPFHVVAESADLWREGLVDLLSTALDATGEFRASDPRAVLNGWRDAVGDTEQLPDPEVAAKVAGTLGASHVILGSLISIGGNQVRLSADLYSVRWLRKEGSASVEGSEDAITSLIDELTLGLLRSVWQGDEVPDVRLSAMTTASIPALRSFLEGEQAFRRSQFADAQASFAAAIQADSTFAIAYYRLAQTYGWFLGIGASEVPRFLAAAERHSQGLSERDSLIILGWKLADVDGGLEAIPLFERLTARYADDMEIWYGLGDAYFHLGGQMGHPLTRAIPALEKSLELDSTFAPSLIHLVELAYYESDTIRGRMWTDQYLELDSTTLYARSFRLLTPLLLGPAADSAAAAQALDTAGSKLLGWMRARFRLSGSELALYEMVALAGADARHPAEDRAEALWSLGLRYLRHGQTALSLDLLDKALALGSAKMGAPVLYVVATARDLGLLTDSTSARMVEELSAAMDYPRQAAFLASHLAREGRLSEASAALAELDSRADSLLAAGDSAFARSTRGQWWTLRGRIAAVRGDVDSAIAYMRRGLPMVNATWSWPRDLDRYRFALLIQDRGGAQEAIAIFGSLYLNPWTEALGYLQRAKLHERRSEREDAVRYYARFVELWQHADPHLQPRVEAARLAIDRLRGERGS